MLTQPPIFSHLLWVHTLIKYYGVATNGYQKAGRHWQQAGRHSMRGHATGGQVLMGTGFERQVGQRCTEKNSNPKELWVDGNSGSGPTVHRRRRGGQSPAEPC